MIFVQDFLCFDKVRGLVFKFYSVLQIKLFFIYLIRKASFEVSPVDFVWQNIAYIRNLAPSNPKL